jgi:1-acyl-sn-glycerol-3-phosphate acyltransferase
VTPWILHLLGTDLLLSLLLPVSIFAPTLAYHVSSRLAYWIWNGIQRIFTRWNGAQITISGHRLPQKESAIVIANHVSWTDFYMIQELALRAGMLPYCRWFAKQQLKWMPFLGWGLWAMGMPLVSRNWDKDQRELQRVFKGPKTYKWPIWLISYSEATRFTPEKYRDTVQWCNSKGKPVPKYTLWPRTRGFVASVKALGSSSSVQAIYDLTIAYAHEGRFLEAPKFTQTLFDPALGESWRFHVYVERFEIQELAGKTDTELAEWLEQRWMAKSKKLQELQHLLSEGKEWPAQTNGLLHGKKRL